MAFDGRLLYTRCSEVGANEQQELALTSGGNNDSSGIWNGTPLLFCDRTVAGLQMIGGLAGLWVRYEVYPARGLTGNGFHGD